ncbi:unnamed protein product [Paramecium pentaurelia]|uniref:Transmembrane protein n=1 Tax=Paramecium pentaurelia TaxID=43138 RepID=A0A8S1UF36_9CILI|nr:unnamed protein product [Paramecium pentaurelia]
MQVKQMIFILILYKVQCKNIITSIINYTNGIIQSQVTQQNLVDFAPFILPLGIIFILSFQLIQYCLRRQILYDLLPLSEKQANKIHCKKIQIPIKHKIQLFLMKYYCQLMRLLTN